ncbi:ABC transporter ATP-binding protein [Aliidongia dinghuensis]|uniref:ABC transporter ATP-binding protein n=1 Tax=Aliidongia dinghuensis TaxID=1867774 RepID=A0A8J3E5M7_9PROT|nr:ABC transporter ATP-binding protein [Aliidongia dinghuensis]GGF36434.1 ABC transporter ATP-binding protein [Aliidongia dinghuensis]
MSALLEARGLVKRFGGLVATDDLSLDVTPGECHAVIGPNGAGKSTLIAQLAGELASDAGTVRFDGREVSRLGMAARARLGLVRSFQITAVLPEFTVVENVALAVQARLGRHWGFWRRAADQPALQDPARRLIEEIGLGPRADMKARTLAHGEQRQLELAMALATKPKLLLLDEPMAGMGPEETRRMTGLLQQLKGRVAMLLVEHDMDAVFALADRVTVLVYGRAIATGAPAAIRADPAVVEAYLGTDEADAAGTV